MKDNRNTGKKDMGDRPSERPELRPVPPQVELFMASQQVDFGRYCDRYRKLGQRLAAGLTVAAAVLLFIPGTTQAGVAPDADYLTFECNNNCSPDGVCDMIGRMLNQETDKV